MPVLIAARNEPNIGRTLAALPDEAWPIVLPNGCTDNTAEIAASLGATVCEPPETGKLPALQCGLQFLGERALEPFITLDADSAPVFPRQWIQALMDARHKLEQGKPACIVGPALYIGVNIVRAAAANYGTWRNVATTQHDPVKGSFPGRNMLLHLHQQEVVAAILQLPNIWPGEDVAMKDAVLDFGGDVMKTGDVRALVWTDNDRHQGVYNRLIYGADYYSALSAASYANDAPPNSIPYHLYQAGKDQRGR